MLEDAKFDDGSRKSKKRAKEIEKKRERELTGLGWKDEWGKFSFDVASRNKTHGRFTFCACSCVGEDESDGELEDGVLVASYNRSVLGQTGEGHFSPVAGLAPSSDMVLVLDTARFKYPPHWVPTPLLWEAMADINPWNGKSRGYVSLNVPSKKDDETLSLIHI